jgi:hypothetical protein
MFSLRFFRNGFFKVVKWLRRSRLREAAFVAASLLATPEHGEGGCEAQC